jgi:hypothetical protein
VIDIIVIIIMMMMMIITIHRHRHRHHHPAGSLSPQLHLRVRQLLQRALHRIQTV